MNIIIPMAGAGQRFADAGYKISKPAIPTIDRKTGYELPMVVCATMDIPGVEPDGSNVTYIDRTFHMEDGIEEIIKQHFPKASFITIDKLTEGQACTCLLAKSKIDNDDELIIAGCDNGMVCDDEKFEELKKENDVLAFTYRHNQAVCEKPDAYGWAKIDTKNHIIGMSVKKAISDTPMSDHAIVATFWFKHGNDFVKAAESMIQANDRINGEFYVDQVLEHCLGLGLNASVFEIDRYIGWGTPKDYEEYQSTYKYWKKFVDDQRCLARR